MTDSKEDLRIEVGDEGTTQAPRRRRIGQIMGVSRLVLKGGLVAASEVLAPSAPKHLGEEAIAGKNQRDIDAFRGLLDELIGRMTKGATFDVEAMPAESRQQIIRATAVLGLTDNYPLTLHEANRFVGSVWPDKADVPLYDTVQTMFESSKPEV